VEGLVDGEELTDEEGLGEVLGLELTDAEGEVETE
jgi:hypothetical protein